MLFFSLHGDIPLQAVLSILKYPIKDDMLSSKYVFNVNQQTYSLFYMTVSIHYALYEHHCSLIVFVVVCNLRIVIKIPTRL